jgi:hypothetical protein
MTSPVLARCFPEHIRQRGTDLAHLGAVRLVRTRDAFTIATVRGTIDYVVTLGIKGRQLTAGCTCPYATGGQFCKHMWALVLTLHTDRRHAEFAALLSQVGQVALKAGPVATETEGTDRSFGVPHEDAIDATRADGLADALDDEDAATRWQLVLDRAEGALRRSLRPGATALAATRPGASASTAEWPDDRRLVYVIDAQEETTGGLTLEIATERRERDGSWSAPRRFAFSTETWFAAPDPDDRQIARLLLGAAPLPDFGHARNTFVLSAAAVSSIIPRVCASGRARLRLAGTPPTWRTVRWDAPRESHGDTPAWHFALTLTRGPERFVLSGTLVRGTDVRPLADALLLAQGALCVLDEVVAPLATDGLWPLIAELARVPALDVGADPGPLLTRLYALPRVPTLVLPDDLSVIDAHVRPVPGIRFVADPAPWRRAGSATTGVQLAFRYGQVVVNSLDVGQTRFCTETQTLHHRDADAEREARDRLVSIGASVVRDSEVRATTYAMPRSQLLRVAQQLSAEGWWVEVDGHAFRTSTGVQAHVTSGIDWFDLHGVVHYGDLSVTLANVLDARKRGANVVVLSDGSHGLLPHEWLDRLGPVLAGGLPTLTGARFQSSQLALLDALLDGLPDVEVDEPFAKAREQLAFVGTLRGYQREGLGWLHFLRTFGFGGCLADDMGLGKTVQVLALLEARRRPGRGRRSWSCRARSSSTGEQEAARFTPELRVLEHTRTGARRGIARHLDAYDLVITTYGTLRRDAASLRRTFEFDYVVLDEAQAIKNAARPRPRPRGSAPPSPGAERHAGREPPRRALWSLFEFLNPGMLGLAVFDGRCGSGRQRGPEQCDAAGTRAAPVHPAPHQGAGRHRAAERMTEQTLVRARAQAARALRRAARPLPHSAARRGRAQGLGSRRCTCSRRCCACGRRRVTPG